MDFYNREPFLVHKILNPEKKKDKQLYQTHGYEIKNLNLRPLDSLLGFSTAGSQGPHCELSHFKTQTCLV